MNGLARYGTTASQRIFERVKGRLKADVEKLRYQTSFRQATITELHQEARILFHQHFEEYYEKEEQYLRFLFIVMKNRIRTMQRVLYTYTNRITNDFTLLRSSKDEPDYHDTWNNVADPAGVDGVGEKCITMEAVKEKCDSVLCHFMEALASGQPIEDVAAKQNWDVKYLQNILRTELVDKFGQISRAI